MPTPTLTSLLDRGAVTVGLEATDKRDAIARLVEGLADLEGVVNPTRLAADVEAREAQLTTGVGEGLALPHARTPAVSQTVAAFATLAGPVDWQALDGEPVTVVLLLAGPEADRATHVRLLAQVSRVLSAAGVRQRLATAATASEVRAVLVEAERGG